MKHYHANNGHFTDNDFRLSVQQSAQMLSFCGVNAHWQNGLAEKRIRDLQDLARTMLIHANHRWPEAITPNLWPYALRMANDVLNSTPMSRVGDSPLNAFAGSKVAINPRHFHTFGCPAYVLDDHLQAQHKIRRWDSRTRTVRGNGNWRQGSNTAIL